MDIEVAKLRLLKADYQSRHYRLEDQLLKFFPQQVKQDTQVLPRLQKDQETVIAHPVPEKHFIGMEIKGKAFSDKEAAGEAILAVCKLASSKDVELVHYARTRKAFEAYRQAGYSKKFAAEHREELEAYTENIGIPKIL